MLERFTRETREVVRRAAEIAESEQAALVQSEHLLLAIVDPARDSVGEARTRAHLGSSDRRRCATHLPRHLLVAIAGAAGRARRQRRGTPPDRKRSLIEPKPAVRQPVRRPSPKCR